MRWLIIYLTISFLLSAGVFVYPVFLNLINKTVSNLIIFTSLPTSKGLFILQKNINKYLLLISVSQENQKLKQELSQCKLNLLTYIRKPIDNSTNPLKLIEATFTFKGNFETDYIYLKPQKPIDIKRNNCFVLSEELSLIGIIQKSKKNGIYIAKTIFNPSFVADVFIPDNETDNKALFIGGKFYPTVEFLDPNVKIKEGDRVYTSGDFAIYPPGLLIGTIYKIKNVNGYYKMAYVKIDRGFFNKWKVFLVCRKKSQQDF